MRITLLAHSGHKVREKRCSIQYKRSMVGLCLALMLWGCQQKPFGRSAGYETIGRDPRRDSELAKRDNLQAIQLIKDAKFPDAEKLLKEALDADVTYELGNLSPIQLYPSALGSAENLF
jgi:hypothetical protein